MKKVDKLYVSVLHLLDRSIAQGVLDANASVLDSLLDVIAPRLSRAASRAVPEAFQALWTRFAGLDIRECSNDTVAFLQSVVAAVPDLIVVPGLSADSEMSEVRSCPSL